MKLSGQRSGHAGIFRKRALSEKSKEVTPCFSYALFLPPPALYKAQDLNIYPPEADPCQVLAERGWLFPERRYPRKKTLMRMTFAVPISFFESISIIFGGAGLIFEGFTNRGGRWNKKFCQGLAGAPACHASRSVVTPAAKRAEHK